MRLVTFTAIILFFILILVPASAELFKATLVFCLVSGAYIVGGLVSYLFDGPNGRLFPDYIDRGMTVIFFGSLLRVLWGV